MDENKKEIIKHLFSGQEKLPTLPTIFGEFNALMASPSVSPRKVAALIKKDQSLIVRIISLCNVALYSKRETIKDITSAVAYLGLENLKKMILQISLSNMFKFGPTEIPDFSPITFWEHSLGTAHFSELIAKLLNFKPNENYYISGLMHDVGKKLIYQCYPDLFEEIVFNQINDDIKDYDSERDVLGVDHTDIGAFFADTWRFNNTVSDAIQNHHSLAESKSNVVTLIVHLANKFAKKADLCFPWDDRDEKIEDSMAWEKIMTLTQGNLEIDVDKITLTLIDATTAIKNNVNSLLQKK